MFILYVVIHNFVDNAKKLIYNIFINIKTSIHLQSLNRVDLHFQEKPFLKVGMAGRIISQVGIGDGEHEKLSFFYFNIKEGLLMIREFQTCPICGHHRWCGLVTQPNGTDLYFCHYQDGPAGSIISGADGIEYVCVKENKNGDGWLLVTKQQRDADRQEWLKQNGKSGNLDSCPICRGQRTCTAFPSKNAPDVLLHLCHGIKGGKPKGLVTGLDGKRYYLIKERDDGSFLCESKEDHDKEVAAFKQKQMWRMPDGTLVPPDSMKRQVVQEKPAVSQTATIVTPEREIVKPANMKKTVPDTDSDHLRSNEDLHTVYQAMIRHLRLLPEHRELLLSDGWTEELISEYQVVSMPLPDKERWNMEKEKKRSGYFVLPWRNKLVELIQEEVGEDLSGVPGFYQLDQLDRETGELIPKWRLAGHNGILFFSRDIKGHTFGAQIRKDVVKPGQSRYTWLSTNPLTENSAGQQLYPNGTSQPVQAAICYRPEKDQSYVAYVTEGFKKGVIGNYYKKAPFIALPGVGQTNAILQNRDEDLIISEYLKKLGTRIIIFAFDADKAKNVNVLRFQYQGLLKMREQGFQIGVADWSMHAAYAKGIDDLLSKGLDCDYELITDQELQKMAAEIERMKK